MPDQSEEFVNIWDSMKFGDYDSFEVAISQLGNFQGGIIKDSTPYQQTLDSTQESFFKEEFNILSEIRRASLLHTTCHTNDDLMNFRFYVLESEDVDKGIVAYHFARFIPKYHILKNKKLLRTVDVQPNTVRSESVFSLEPIIIIEPIVFASAIYSQNGDESNIQLFVYQPDVYEKAFILKNSYFEYAKKTFESFRSTDPSTKRTVSSNGISVNWDDKDFSPETFFDNKNVNIAKKFARDSFDDKKYPVQRIVEANNKLNSNNKLGHKPLKVIYDNNGTRVLGLLVDETSVATLAAILDGQIWTNEIHQQTQTNI